MSQLLQQETGNIIVTLAPIQNKVKEKRETGQYWCFLMVENQDQRDKQFMVSWKSSKRCSSSTVSSLEWALQKLLSDCWDAHKQSAWAAVDGGGSWTLFRTLLWSIHQTDPSVLIVEKAHAVYFFWEMKMIFTSGQVYYHPHDSHIISFQYKPS